jgi:hypothetical protein
MMIHSQKERSDAVIRESCLCDGVRFDVHIFVDSKAPWKEIYGPQLQFRQGLNSERIDGPGKPG